MINEKNSDIHLKNDTLTDDFKKIVKQKIPVNFDLSVIGKIDLSEAEKIAGEEVIFLKEDDLIEGLEDFELVPVKDLKYGIKPVINFIESVPEQAVSIKPEYKEEVIIQEDIKVLTEEFVSDSDSKQASEDVKDQSEFAKEELSANHEQQLVVETVESVPDEVLVESVDEKIIFEEVVEVHEELAKRDKDNSTDNKSVISITDEAEDDELPKRFFTVKISEKTLDDQLSSILNSDYVFKFEDKSADRFKNEISSDNCRFVDDCFFNKPEQDEGISYNEDPLTERLVKMIEVADSKLELIESSTKESDFPNYILEDYTLYNPEQFEIVFKEEIFYQDSDFEFIDNAIIRDDFTKYIHEIDDYFDSEDSFSQSLISEILGLVPEEKDYIDDKLFGDYYKKYDLDNEIDFIKPEIDFFRRDYAGKKNASYFISDDANIREYEKMSIEEDITSPDAVIFDEDISEIKEILLRDYSSEIRPEIISITEIGEEAEELYVIEVKEESSTDAMHELEAVTDSDSLKLEIEDITDKIIIMDDKEQIMELVSDYPDKHDNLMKLLSYLDGLFEKLPEEVIRKFAESEYFELYSKVLKEMGV